MYEALQELYKFALFCCVLFDGKCKSAVLYVLRQYATSLYVCAY